MIYQYHGSHDTQATCVTVTHACGHTATYSYGGTNPTFDKRRAAFALGQSAGPCWECAVVAALAPHAAPPCDDLPVLAAGAGYGRLVPRAGTVVFLTDAPVIVGRWNNGATYTFVARVLDPAEASYLHLDDRHAYTPDELDWLSEYAINAACHGWRNYSTGASISYTAEQIIEIERRTHKPVYLASSRESYQRDRAQRAQEQTQDDLETARHEISMDLSYERLRGAL